MVYLTKFPRHDNLSILQQFYYRTDPQNTTPHITQLLVDDTFIPVNTVVLSIWSEKFEEIRDNDDVIVLDGFTGHFEEVKDCLDLLHDHHVDICF